MLSFVIFVMGWVLVYSFILGFFLNFLRIVFIIFFIMVGIESREIEMLFWRGVL